MRLLAVFAHPDDELGCIGTLAKHAARGDAVMLAWTTHGELASQFHSESDAEVRRVRRGHGAWVADRIGAEHRFFDLGDSRLRGSRDEALALAGLYSEFRPDAVITWSDDHGHPDHRATARIAFDAVTLARIPKIVAEAPRAPDAAALEPHRRPVRFLQYPSAGSARPLMHVDVSAQAARIEEVFEFYRSFYDWKHSAARFMAALAERGREGGVRYAEVFQRRTAFAPAVAFLEPP